MEKINFAFESFKNIQDLIKFVDQKSSAVLVVTGLIFTGYIQFLEDLNFSLTEGFSFYGIITFIASLVTVICLFMVVHVSIFKVLKPRTAEHYSKGETSLFYYEHLVQVGKENVLKAYETIDNDIILKNIIDQQHEVSKILKEKTTELGKSFNWLFASIVSVILFVIFSIQLKNGS